MSCLPKKFRCKLPIYGTANKDQRAWILTATCRENPGSRSMPSPFVASLLNHERTRRLCFRCIPVTGSDETGNRLILSYWFVKHAPCPFVSVMHMGLIIWLSSCSMMWQCQAKSPRMSNLALIIVIVRPLARTVSLKPDSPGVGGEKCPPLRSVRPKTSKPTS